MATCEITDTCNYWDADGTVVAIANVPVYAVPGSSASRYDNGSGVYRTLGVNPLIETLAYQRGRVAITDGGGSYTFNLPQRSSTHPGTPDPIWTIILPSGDQWYGTVPDAAGPFTIDDLATTYDWVQSDTIYVQPVTQGAFSKGVVTISADTTASIVFDTAYDTDDYEITLTPSLNSITSLPPGGCAWTNKSTTGFDIVIGETFTGSVSWIADAT